MRRFLLYVVICMVVSLVALRSGVVVAKDPSANDLIFMGQGQGLAINPLAYPTDPTTDIAWAAGYSGVTDIQTAFNTARTAENVQLGTTIPLMSLPNQAAWDGMSSGDKALWLINRERIDRGVQQLHGLETNVGDVAQTYAQYLMDNNLFSHTADGRDPWQRLSDNPTIGACYDFLNVAENLAAFFTSSSSIALPIERSIYMWMYEDQAQGWGHRHAILWYPYNDNSGPAGQEGFLGIGLASGPYQGWPLGNVIVMNVFDPCATWNYGTPTTTYSVSGRLTDNNGDPIVGAIVDAGNGHSATTDASGNYVITGLAPGTYTISISVAGSLAIPSTFTVTIVDQNLVNQDHVIRLVVPTDFIYLPIIFR